MIKQVYLDLDGVLVDFVAYILEQCELKQSDLIPNVYDLSTSLKIDLMNLLSNWSIEDWQYLSPTEEMFDIISLIFQFYDPKKVIICTRLFDANSAAGKTLWLKQHLPEWVYVLTNKKCRLANKHTLLIDDSDHEINKFIANGGHGILIPRIWNSGHANTIPFLQHLEEGLRRVKDITKESFY